MSDDVTVLEPITVYGSDPSPNIALAKELNLPQTTLFHEPDRAAGYVDYKSSLDAEEQRAYFNDPEEGDEYHPPPTTADPSPPNLFQMMLQRWLYACPQMFANRRTNRFLTCAGAKEMTRTTIRPMCDQTASS